MNQPKKSQAGRIVLTVLLCIVLFFSAIGATLAADLHQLTDRDNLQALLRQVMVGSAPHSHIRMGALSAGIPGAIPSGQSGETGDSVFNSLVDQYYDQLQQQMEIPFSKEEVKGLLEQTTIPEYLSDKTADVLTDLFNGTQDTVITEKEITDLIEENRAVIEQLLDGPIPEEAITNVVAWVNENGDTLVADLESAIVDSMGSVDPGESTSGDVMTTPGLFLLETLRSSGQILLTAAVTCLVLSLLIMLVNLKKPASGLRSNGITYLLAGLVCAVPYVLGTLASDMLPPAVAGLAKLVMDVVLKPAFFVAGLGALLLIAGIIWGVAAGNRAARESVEPQ